MEDLSRVFQKQKRKKKKHEEIEFHNSIQDWVLLPFTGCRKVLGKMPALMVSSRISDLSCGKEYFDKAAPTYNKALKISGFNENIEFM